MTPAVLGSVSGAAALTLGRGAAAAAGNGLSFAGELLSASATATAKDDESAVDRERSVLERRMADLSERIRRKLAESGVTLNKPLELTSDGAGGISLAGDHPQRKAIEEILRNDFLLERDFDHLAGDYHDFVDQFGAGDSPAALTIAVPASPGTSPHNTHSAF
jgi:hypothetical protein